MRKILLSAVLVIFFLMIGFYNLEASAGVGIMLGDPTGISLKFNNFPIMGIAWSLSDYFQVHADYWIMNRIIEKQFYWYFGAGAKMFFFDQGNNIDHGNSGAGLGVRMPLGLQYLFEERFELFGEIVPGIRLFPATDIDLDAAIGLRYYI